MPLAGFEAVTGCPKTIQASAYSVRNGWKADATLFSAALDANAVIKGRIRADHGAGGAADVG
jgi:hypothetical protein